MAEAYYIIMNILTFYKHFKRGFDKVMNKIN